jgi:hypothetical protein
MNKKTTRFTPAYSELEQKYKDVECYCPANKDDEACLVMFLVPAFAAFVIVTGVCYFVLGIAYLPLSILFIAVATAVFSMAKVVQFVAKNVVKPMVCCACESCCYVREAATDACNGAATSQEPSDETICAAPDPVVMNTAGTKLVKDKDSFVSTSSAGSLPIKAVYM